ncbi:MAG: hypothetical protein ACRENJ_09930 [Candidatus Eiseniibacteriota bacterium]
MPYFNAESGALNDPMAEAELAAEQAEQQQGDRERRDAIGSGKKPAEPGPASEPDAGSFTLPDLSTPEKYQAFITEYTSDDYHPMRRDDAYGQALAHHFALAGSRLSGHTDGEEVLGTLHDARILAPEDHPPVRVTALSETAQAAGLTWVPDQVEALCGIADDSGVARYHMEQLFAEVGAGAEEEVASGTSYEAGVQALVRTEGAGRAAHMINEARDLVEHLRESGMPELVAAAEDLEMLSNNPRVIRAAAAFYQELKTLPPQGPWEQLLLGGGAKWAKQQAAAKARAAKAAQADQTPPDHIVTYGGRA